MIIHNTLGQKDEDFNPMHPGRINMFVCGPTVYDHSHIGHARTNIFFDVIAKYLRARGYSVFYLQNITDIDDKIINRAAEEGKKYNEVADHYFEEYKDIMEKLRIDSINYYARASLYIEEIINQIKRIMEHGYAYETKDGVYFNVKKFSAYGELSNQNLDQIRENARGVIKEEKNAPEDFVLWKKMKPGEPFWDSPWGKGRPGWHIEDTAITEAYFGTEYDIHGGGNDLIFPHHEAEIAQMRSVSGKRYLARYWLHTGMVNINSEKMSKSLKNFIQTKDILKIYKPEELRFAMVNSNYNTIIDYSDQLMKNSQDAVGRINIFYNKIKEINSSSGNYHIDIAERISHFNEVMDKNFDTRGLIREFLAFISDVNKNIKDISSDTASNIIQIVEYVDSFLNIIYRKNDQETDIMDIVIDIRNHARMQKDYAISDYIRKKLEENNIYIEDNGDKTTWWIKN
jgi:cysteinyl-tRNA synthetase